ncbi:unnamed protein product [Phyllotreta striolata]|uniref:YqaJ viral recombinase domain-containing protein n=1 Tax=Phyllotreta striolata TaxID=444603 RepID=A0A9N9XSU4_PHYSR|nr:unnamed protein product [Phyllotreta striolata]
MPRYNRYGRSRSKKAKTKQLYWDGKQHLETEEMIRKENEEEIQEVQQEIQDVQQETQDVQQETQEVQQEIQDVQQETQETQEDNTRHMETGETSVEKTFQQKELLPTNMNAENGCKSTKEHVCYKNWDNSAPAMEADMVVQGFNISEEMHGLRFNQGKRLNLIQRGSYQRRVQLSGLRYNGKTEWHTSPYKDATGSSPGQHFKTFLKRQVNSAEKKSCRKRLFDGKPDNATKPKKAKMMPNHDYGPKADQLEDPEMIVQQVEEIIKGLHVTELDRDRIQISSIGQFGNEVYESERKHRLTASLFGRVVKRKKHTPCHALVRSILKQSNCMTEAMEYGILKEKVAKGIFEKSQNLQVSESGLWIDTQNPYLAASPDGLIGNDAIIEVKCLHSASKLPATTSTLDEVIDLLGNKICLEKRDNKIQLKRNHNYYYQVYTGPVEHHKQKQMLPSCVRW